MDPYFSQPFGLLGTHPQFLKPPSQSSDLESPPASPLLNPLNDASPFRARLDTNYVPSDEDMLGLHNLVDRPRTNRANLDDQIARLKEEVSRLKEEKRPITHFIRSHAALMHPLRRLPLEVLQEIFFHCLTADRPGLMHMVDTPPVVLTRVCQLWRRVALTTPILWTQIHIPLVSPSVENDEMFSRRLIRIQDWLSRSKSLPLSISILEVDFDPFDNNTRACPPTRFSDTFTLLYRHVSRWEHLQIQATVRAAQAYVDIPPTELPALKSIYFRGMQSNADYHANNLLPSDSTLVCPRFFGAPALKEVAITSTFQSNASFFPLPGVKWANITSIKLGECFPIHDLPQFLRLFATTNVLEEMCAQFGAYYGEESTMAPLEHGTTISFPCLKRITICERARGFSWFGEAVRCPVLEELEYHPIAPPMGYPNPTMALQQPTPNPTPTIQPGRKLRSRNLIAPPSIDFPFLSLTSHSGAFIHTLTFDPKPYMSTQILTSLASCPNLEHLIMVKGPNTHTRRRCGRMRRPPEPPLASIDAPLLAALTSPSSVANGQITCPRLSTFVCEVYKVSFTLEHFVEFLRVKQGGTVEGVEKLKRIVVNFGSTEDDELHSEALSLVEGGASNAHFSFFKDTTQTSSVRDGIWQNQILNSWHSVKDDF